MTDRILRTYSAAGGIVVDASTDRVLVLIVPVSVGRDGRPEARLPKGHIESGESREEAAAREVLEETGLRAVRILEDLGHQTVEFDDAHRHTIRDESYFLMVASSHDGWGEPEPKYVRSWLSWDEAIDRLTYEPECEWVRRARLAWGTHAAAYRIL